MKSKRKTDEGRRLMEITLSPRGIYILHQRVSGAQVTGERDIRDRNQIIRAIEETDYDHDFVVGLIDEIADRRSALEKKQDEDGKGIQRELSELDKYFFERLGSMCEPQAIVLKQRQIDFVRKILNSVPWVGSLLNAVEDVFDSFDGAVEYEEPIDKEPLPAPIKEG